MRSILIALLLSGSVQAATVTWDPLDPSYAVRLYIDGQQVVETAAGAPNAEITLPKAGGVLTARSVVGNAMSAESDPLTIPAAPSNVTITITFGAN